ncbi:MAG: hypothetical protein U9P81_02340 [Euryarchaeota archaeon]|nr:hypothetical protein [Euryarchaeota archaeon]
MGNVSKKVEGIDIVRLRCYVQFENRTGDIDIQDAIVDTDAFISLIPFFITAVSGTPPVAHDLRINATEQTLRFYQEIYNSSGKLIEIHEKYPKDRGHIKVRNENNENFP